MFSGKILCVCVFAQKISGKNFSKILRTIILEQHVFSKLCTLIMHYIYSCISICYMSMNKTTMKYAMFTLASSASDSVMYLQAFLHCHLVVCRNYSCSSVSPQTFIFFGFFSLTNCHAYPMIPFCSFKLQLLDN